MSNKTLVVFYTHSGNTKKIAEEIQKQTQGVLFEVEPVSSYPTSYNAVVDQAKKEIQAGYHPALKEFVSDIESYETVFVGSPNWWSTIAPPIATFLSATNMSGKTVIPFCTHGGGGGGRVEKDIAKLCGESTVKSGLVVSGSGGSQVDKQVSTWLRAIGIIG